MAFQKQELLPEGGAIDLDTIEEGVGEELDNLEKILKPLGRNQLGQKRGGRK